MCRISDLLSNLESIRKEHGDLLLSYTERESFYDPRVFVEDYDLSLASVIVVDSKGAVPVVDENSNNINEAEKENKRFNLFHVPHL